MNKLDKFERELLNAFEEKNLQRSPNLSEEKQIAKQAAKSYLTKDKRINIRLSSTDLELLKRKAAVEGLPYQTLIGSILHKYVSGHF